MRSKSAGGLKVKALGWTPRDLGSSPSWHSNFSCYKIALEKIFIYIHNIKQFEKHYGIDGDRSPMRMHMSISSKEDDVHAHVHPIIFYACSAHVHCVKVLDRACLSSWLRVK